MSVVVGIEAYPLSQLVKHLVTLTLFSVSESSECNQKNGIYMLLGLTEYTLRVYRD